MSSSRQEDLKGTKGSDLNQQKMKETRAKERLKPKKGVGSKPQSQRGVIKDVSGLILDEIKEETNSVADSSTDVKINKILVRTPAVGMCADSGSSSGMDTPTESGPDMENNKDTQTEQEKEDVPLDIKPIREVSFSAKSEGYRTSERKSVSRKKKRPKSAMRFTKEDMDMFLPRKSFFNSHDKILTDAGHQVDIHKERKKPDWRRILRMHTMDELYPPKVDSEADKEEVAGARDEESDSEDELFSLEKTETLLSKENKKPRSKSKKRDGNPEREEYKPLYDYFKYILDNPEEYVTATKFTAKNLDYKHPNNMVRMGRIYRRGSNIRNSIYLHALSRLKAANPETTANTTQDESELTKLKSKAEIWLRDLSTHQFLRAKELALKDVGEEDINTTKWWMAFKACQYLRLPKHVVVEK